jgi:hypothetical protein
MVEARGAEQVWPQSPVCVARYTALAAEAESTSANTSSVEHAAATRGAAQQRMQMNLQAYEGEQHANSAYKRQQGVSTGACAHGMHLQSPCHITTWEFPFHPQRLKAATCS